MALLAGGILTAAYLLQRWMHRQQTPPRLGIWRDAFSQVVAFNPVLVRAALQMLAFSLETPVPHARSHRVEKIHHCIKLSRQPLSRVLESPALRWGFDES
jgi:hypothetical protein